MRIRSPRFASSAPVGVALRRGRLPGRLACLCFLGLVGVEGTALLGLAHADEPRGDDKQRAATAFDDAVAKYKRAEYDAAARGFLVADGLAPSELAITNAIAAGRKANDHLLVARAAEKAIARGQALGPAREALVEAATRLSRVELGCDAPACALTLDGDAVRAGIEYVLPGTHQVVASAQGGAHAAESMNCVAGATYRVALHPAADAALPATSPASQLPPASAGSPDRAQPAPASGLPPAVFFVGVGATVVLGALTIWSGTDALAAKRALPAQPEQSQDDAVLARAHRTDALLAGAALAGLGTAALGVWGTKWGGGSASVAFDTTQCGASVAVRGRF